MISLWSSSYFTGVGSSMKFVFFLAGAASAGRPETAAPGGVNGGAAGGGVPVGVASAHRAELKSQFISRGLLALEAAPCGMLMRGDEDCDTEPA
jgi:hypothetical protein